MTRSWVSLVVAAAFAALLIALAVVNRVNAARVQVAAQSVAATYAVTTELAEMLSTLVDAETGQRGFVITGEDRYLEPYQAAVAAVQAHIERVAALTADNADHQADIQRVRSLAAEKLAELQQSILVRRTSGFPAAQQIVSTDRGTDERTRRPVANPLAAALESGTLQALANHRVLIARDGTERPVDDSAAPMPDVSYNK